MTWTLHHDDLVREGVAWLRRGVPLMDVPLSTCPILRTRRVRCSVVVSELAGGGREHPDVIGWAGGTSILVECKASRADFRADAKKPFRRPEVPSLGCSRWYLTRPGLLSADEVPDRWGLAEVTGRGRVRVVRQADAWEPDMCRTPHEVNILLSVIHRLPADIEGVSCRWYTDKDAGKAKRATITCGDDCVGELL